MNRAKGKHTQVLSKAVAMVGKAKLPIALQSQQFRLLVRAAAASCANQTMESKQLSSRCIPILKKRYRDAIFATLALSPVLGEQAQSLIFEDYDFEDLEFWPILEAGWKKSRHSLSIAQHARIRRINIASSTCSVEILRNGIESLEKALRLQIEIGTSVRSAAPKNNASKPKRLIQVPIPWEASDPELQIGKNGAFFGFNSLHPTALNNTIAIGGTGSGKTKSVVIPLLEALLDYELTCGKQASLLVIDPKRELTAVVTSKLASRGELARLVVIGETMPIPIFAKDCTLSMSDRLAKLEVFAPAEHAASDHSYWKNLGMGVVRDLLQLEQAFSQSTGGKRLANLMCKELCLPDTAGLGFWPQLRAVLAHSRTSKARLKEVDMLLRSLCAQAMVSAQATQVMQVYAGDEELMRQWCYAIQSAEPMVNALANPDIAQYVDLDPIQIDHGQHTDIPDLMERGKIVLFCPEPTEGHRIAAMSIKQRFFESVFSRIDQRRPMGIVIDEAHKFVTSDAETGEQGFLDRCRAYRCLVVLATQSIASLKHALGSSNTAQTAVEILTANTPTKIVMRTTDIETVAWLKTQLPSRDGDAHIIDVRRPATLRPGEAYFLLANGAWGRKRALISPVTETHPQQGKHG